MDGNCRYVVLGCLWGLLKRFCEPSCGLFRYSCEWNFVLACMTCGTGKGNFVLRYMTWEGQSVVVLGFRNVSLLLELIFLD